MDSLSPIKAIFATALCALAITLFTACQRDRVEKPAPGQPTMNQLMHRRAAPSRPHEEKETALMERARTLTPDQTQQLLTKLTKQNPQDTSTYWTLVRHYEYAVDTTGLNALRLWYIEHQPAGKLPPANINPHLDQASYARGKKLWLAQLKRPDASPQTYRRAADFLEGADKPMAESVLQTGQKLYPNDDAWGIGFRQPLRAGAPWFSRTAHGVQCVSIR